MSTATRRKGRSRKGVGTIYEYRPGRFRGMVDLGKDSSGKRIRKSFTGSSVEEVQQKIDEARNRLRKGMPVESSDRLVSDFFEQWLTQKKLELRKSTYARYYSHYKTHIEKNIGHLKLKELSAVAINEMYKKLLEQGLTKTTVHSVSMVLQAALNQATEQGLLVRNPAKEAANIQPDTEEARFLSPREIQLVLAAAKDQGWIENAIIVFLGTGMRAGELFGLPWHNVDFDKRIIIIDRAAHNVGADVFIGQTKTNAGRRIIPMSNRVKHALLRQKEWVDKLAHNPHNLVFPAQNGSIMRRNNVIRRPLRRVLNRATLISMAWRLNLDADLVLDLNEPLIYGKRITAENAVLLPDGTVAYPKDEDLLEGVTLHSLRHTYVSLLLAQGTDIKTISYLVGHKKLSVTMDVYSHLLPGQNLTAGDAIDAAMEQLEDQET